MIAKGRACLRSAPLTAITAKPVRFGDQPRLGGLNPHIFDPILTLLPDFSILSAMNSLLQV
jgi:hypothetical protein